MVDPLRETETDSFRRLHSNPRSWLLESDLAPHVEVYVDYLRLDQYVANLTIKERALAKLQEPDCKFRRYRAPDTLLEFPQTL